MNCKNLFFILSICFVLSACKTTQEVSYNAPLPERHCVSSLNTRNQFSIVWYKHIFDADGIKCIRSESGICLKLSNVLIVDEPTCFIKNENSTLSMAIPQYNTEQTVNPQFEMFDNMDVFSVNDSLIIWNEESLGALNFASPIAVLPDDYRIDRSHDTLYVNLHTCPVSLEKKVCMFFNCHDYVITGARFQDYYKGFLGASDILTGIISEVDDEYLVLTFHFEFNDEEALHIVDYIIGNGMFRIREDIYCSDHSIYDILEFTTAFKILNGEYEIDIIDGGFTVKLPYTLLDY